MIKHKDCISDGCQSKLHHGHECHRECDAIVCQEQTMCWSCNKDYDISEDKCPHCGKANANIDIDLAEHECALIYTSKPERDMTAKHTPGPWKACKPMFGQQDVRQDPADWDGNGYQLICTVPQSKKGSHYGEMFKANAALIARAPDLLADNARLRALNEELAKSLEYIATGGEDWKDCCKNARAALSKYREGTK